MATRPGGSPRATRRAAAAVILSLVYPGLGHIYARTWRYGLVLLVLNEALSIGVRLVVYQAPPIAPAIAVIAALVLASLALMIYAASDAARRILKAAAADRGPRLAALPRPFWKGLFRTGWYRSTWFAAIVLIGLGFAVDAAIPFHWRAFYVPTASMAPTLLVGDTVVVDARAGLDIGRGAVVVFVHPAAKPDGSAGPDTVYVKRVIGLPGDRIAIRDGRVVENGQVLPRRADGDFLIPKEMSFGTKADRFIETLPNDVSYPVLTVPDATPPRTLPELTVPPGMIYVLGDNRDNSQDSRTPGFGTVPTSRVIGQARTIYWSRDRARLMQPVK